MKSETTEKYLETGTRSNKTSLLRLLLNNEVTSTDKTNKNKYT